VSIAELQEDHTRGHQASARLFYDSGAPSAMWLVPACPVVPGSRLYDRVSIGRREVLRAIALAPGGHAGAAGRVPPGVNRMTLIRLLRGLPGPGREHRSGVLGADLSRSRDYPDRWRGRDGMPRSGRAREGPGAGQVGIIPAA
jgi:hypothetical protein